MSDPKLFGVLTGSQITLLGALAILAPSAVYAVANTPVVITDPLTGKEGYVDAGRRLSVYDPIAGYANNPLNLVNISGKATIGSFETVYTVPTGKALILKSANMTLYDGTAGADNYFYFLGGASANFITGFDTSNISGAVTDDLESGFYLHSGDIVTSYASGENRFSLRGYLVPSNAVPLMGQVEAVQQSVHVGDFRGK